MILYCQYPIITAIFTFSVSPEFSSCYSLQQSQREWSHLCWMTTEIQIAGIKKFNQRLQILMHYEQNHFSSKDVHNTVLPAMPFMNVCLLNRLKNTHLNPNCWCVLRHRNTLVVILLEHKFLYRFYFFPLVW